jgi:RNA polymerase sigma-70 factor (ECF subfamily)
VPPARSGAGVRTGPANSSSYGRPIASVTSPRRTTHNRPGSVQGVRGGAPSTPEAGSAAGGDGRAPGAPAFAPSELERVRAREPEALAAFFERYFEQVFGLVFRLLGERSLAEDVTQEVFLKVHRAIHRLDVARDPSPWLTTIAYNACRDLWRSGQHRMGRHSAPLDDPAVAPRLASSLPDPEGVRLEAERASLVREAVARLPEPLRAAVLLHDYQGLSHEQVARLAGINPAAARKRYWRALAALGAMLKETLG